MGDSARMEKQADIFERMLASEALKRAAGRLAPGEAVHLAGVWGSSAALLAAAVGRLRNAPVLLVTPHLDAADDAAEDIEVLASADTTRPVLFPAWDTDVFAADHVNDEIAGERMRVCNALAHAGFSNLKSQMPDSPAATKVSIHSPQSTIHNAVLVAPVMALLQPVPSREALREGRLTLAREAELSPDALAAWLVDAGFEHVDQVDQQGEFARRGGILDVFPAGVGQAVRVEFFGDRIDSIRLFDLDTQRSTEQVESYDLTAVATGRQTDPQRTTSLLSYLPGETVVCLVEPGEVTDLAAEIHRRLSEQRHEAAGVLDAGEVLGELRRLATVGLHAFRPSGDAPSVNLGIRSIERLSANTSEALRELANLADEADVWVFCENAAERDRFRDLLADADAALPGRIRTGIGHVASGFHWPDRRLAVVGHHEIFHRYAKRRRLRRVRAGRPIESLLDLSPGDYVVHVGHGIARFRGLRRLERDGRTEEYLTLAFADNALLHVPATRIDLIQRYVAPGRARPTLSRLGGVAWSNAKQRVTEAVHDMAADMLRVQAMRQAMPGSSYPLRTQWQARFEAEFIYSETEDQLASMDQIARDLHAPRPMDRLLCGDVGYGKTELAMRAAFKVVEGGRQAAVLVPTTVLADQHGRTFRERLADYPFSVEVVSRFRGGAETADVLKRLAAGQVDVLIGTHRLLSADVKFADLGLVVIDEEQRFGVEHKEHLKRLRASVDVLTMTATPIPRTLHMALLGLRDISSLATPPLDRRAIHTEVVHYDDRLIRTAILRELNRQGQVFFVHNRVFDIDALADRVRKLVPEARVAVGHGQMSGRQLEDTMLRFVRGEIDVLVCTTIIESGLDIPTANTMIIHDADRYGLADLHQLRGRVGRYKHLAYCYLLLPETRPVSPAAGKRLKAVEEFSDLGAGFQIAMRDLEIRGAGNILGRAQSGHIAAVGYELYCQLLERAVREMKGEAAPTRAECHVELGIDAYVPRSYVPSDRQRMEVYRQMVRCAGRAELEELRERLRDAYGPLPGEAETLLDLTEIRVLAGELGVESIIRMEPDLIFAVRDFERAKGIFDGGAGSVRLPDAETAHWRLPKAYHERPTLLRILLKHLRQAAGAI